SKLGAWGRALLWRLRAIRVMEYNQRLARDRKQTDITAEEAKQIELTNKYRIMMGRMPLELCPKLVQTARKHSQEMVRLGYFSHESPVPSRRTPAMRAKLEGHDPMVGENIYMNTGGATAQAAFDGWYHSSGHHRNMLSDRWTCLGTGHASTRFTQNFGGCRNCAR
ncbi:MAG: CAP domain-containing protein, partial [Planctomycetota bacterium]